MYVSDLGRREFSYAVSMGYSTCTVEQCYADVLTFGEPGPYLVDLLWSKGLHYVDEIYALSGRGGPRFGGLVVWESLLTGNSASWGRFDPYAGDFEEWLDCVARWATWAALDGGETTYFAI